MIGIYKITNPKGKVYIGQAYHLEERREEYRRLECKGQPKIYNSLVKYGFSEHIFEIIEQCTIKELNTRERYWQDYYNVISENGLNCILQNTLEKPKKYSQETTQKMSASMKDFIRSDRGQEITKNAIIKRKHFWTTEEGLKRKVEMISKFDYVDRNTKIDFEKRTANTDYQARNNKIDWKALQAKRVKTMDWEAKAKKCMKPILQFNKDNTFIREWNSVKEAGETLLIDRSNISGCCRGKQKTAGGFIWKYKNN
jgi:group I intron endonuclease